MKAFLEKIIFLKKINNRTLLILLAFCFSHVSQTIFAQEEHRLKSYNLQSPYHTVLTHLYFLQPETYKPEHAARTMYRVRDAAKAEKFAIQLKQVLDGKGLYINIDALPQDRNYVDSIAQRSVYILSDELPEVYVEKIGNKWYYSRETVEAIPRLHGEVFPFGSDVLLKVLPTGKTLF